MDNYIWICSMSLLYITVWSVKSSENLKTLEQVLDVL